MNLSNILLVTVGFVIVVGAVLHTILFPELPLPTWLVTAVATIVGYLFGYKKEIAVQAFQKKK